MTIYMILSPYHAYSTSSGTQVILKPPRVMPGGNSATFSLDRETAKDDALMSVNMCSGWQAKTIGRFMQNANGRLKR